MAAAKHTKSKAIPFGKGVGLRSLTIAGRVRTNTHSHTLYPEITICGNWLTELGFVPGARVNLITQNKLLIVLLADDGSAGANAREGYRYPLGDPFLPLT